MGIKLMGKWEWGCSVRMGKDGNGNGNDSMGVGREWEQESHSRTPLYRLGSCVQTYNAHKLGIYQFIISIHRG